MARSAAAAINNTPQYQEQFAVPTPIGLTIPIDPMLAAAGAYWSEQRELVVQRTRKPVGVPFMQNGRLVQKFVGVVERVAPPGMPIEQARESGLHFYSPQLGWIWWGIKRAAEYPENLGEQLHNVMVEEVGDPDADAE